jgi:hypothetical protein
VNKTTYIIITIILIFIITEILLRFIGFSPKVFNQKFISKPEISFVPDSLGISLKKGKYKININNCLEFVATHNSEELHLKLIMFIRIKYLFMVAHLLMDME